ncbi:MAG: TetR/AcrR family transcriptional regulator [Clostridium sp.]|nr:TetR/AcrR family transcriptional regulator [Clostridium sp.]
MNTKGKVKRMTKEDREKQILSSALKVFVEKGYNGATTQEIAKSADVSEVTLFRYFASKEEIFMKSVDPIIIDTLKDSITASDKLSPVEQFKYVLTERMKVISTNYEVLRLILMESQISDKFGEMDYITKVTNIIKDMMLKTGMEIENEELALRLLMGGILSFLYIPDEKGENIKEFVEKITNSLKSCF